MNIDDLVLSIAICHEAKLSLFIHGPQGVGKSKALRKYCNGHSHFEDAYVPYGLVDLRCAQMEASEIRGLPDKDPESKRVVYLVPNELPKGEWINNRGEVTGEPGDPKPEDTKDTKWTLHRGLLLGDEINRGEDDVLNAWFELVWDRKVGEYELPTGWSVVVAGNPSGGGFTVNSFVNDNAFKDRFVHVFIDIDDTYKKSWANYMMDLEGLPDGLSSKIIEFCMVNEDHLHRNDNDVDDFVITPSPRSWEMLARVESAIDKFKMDVDTHARIRYQLISGLIGDIAQYYIDHSVDISPKEVIEEGMSKRIVKLLKKLDRTRLQCLSWNVASMAKKMDNPDDKYIANTISFGKWIGNNCGMDDKDLAVAFFDIILEKEQNAVIRSICLANESLRKILQKRGGGIWFSAITSDEELSKFLHKSHRGQL